MKVKSKSQLEAYASQLWQQMEKDLKPCETVYVISEITKIMSLEMLKKGF